MMLSEAKKFHEYARECLQLAEQVAEPDIRKILIQLSHIWMEAALKEERHILHEPTVIQIQNTETCSPELDRHDSHQCFHPGMICGSS